LLQLFGRGLHLEPRLHIDIFNGWTQLQAVWNKRRFQ
jgi:hypothetical protein